MKRKNRKKAVIITVVAVLLVAAMGLGLWYFLANRSTDPVNVYPFMYVGMTEYWGDNQESYGSVTTDKIQTVFLSDTQSVVDVLVSQGDLVKKGDLLMTFDTTLTDLSLERERLAVEKLKLRLEDAQKRLKEIRNMKPMVIPTTPEPEEEQDLGMAISGSYQISTNKTYDGSSPDKALILWLREDVQIDGQLLETLRQTAVEYQTYNRPAATEPTDPAAASASGADTGATEAPTEAPTEEPTEAPTDAPVEVYSYFVVCKVTEGNMSLGAVKTWQGMEVTGSSAEDMKFRFFDAAAVTDHTMAQPTTPGYEPEIDFGSGFTATQLAQMRNEQEKTIRDLEFQIRMAEANYKIKQTEAQDGNVYAQIDGTVVSLLSEEEAQATMQPILKVSGGGGFYVECTVSELEKANLQLGQEVTVNDWSTGMVYTGTIQSVGDFPVTGSGWNGIGNPNASYYPFRVYIDGSADLQEGNYVNVVYSTAGTQQGIYLENPFLRTQQGRSYVYVAGADGKLEKRYVTTGKSLWGSYTQILDGITEEDLLAFPYGKNLKEGADTVESDLSALYG